MIRPSQGEANPTVCNGYIWLIIGITSSHCFHLRHFSDAGNNQVNVAHLVTATYWLLTLIASKTAFKPLSAGD